MTIGEAWQVVREQVFGLGSLEHPFMERVEAFRILQPIIEAAEKITDFDLGTEDWPSEELHRAIFCAKTGKEPKP